MKHERGENSSSFNFDILCFRATSDGRLSGHAEIRSRRLNNHEYLSGDRTSGGGGGGKPKRTFVLEKNFIQKKKGF
jgi:hypothetical protein